MAMPGMSASLAADFPALAVVLALFMTGYIIWTTDRLATLAPPNHRSQPGPHPRPPPNGYSCGRHGPAQPVRYPSHARRHRNPAG